MIETKVYPKITMPSMIITPINKMLKGNPKRRDFHESSLDEEGKTMSPILIHRKRTRQVNDKVRERQYNENDSGFKSNSPQLTQSKLKK